MVKKRRPGVETVNGVPKASRRDARDAALARAAGADAAPQEESEEEALIRDELGDEAEAGDEAPEVEDSSAKRPAKKRRKAKEAAAAAAASTAAASSTASSSRSSASGSGRVLSKWSENDEKVARWVESRGGGLEEPLKAAEGGILRLRDLFPSDVANDVLAVLEGLPESAWELSEQGGEEDAARHRFWSADLTDVPVLAPLRGVFWRMLKSFRGEPTLPIFSAARYGASDFIGRHDDRAHVPFFSDGNVYSRTVAAIWYLTRDWSAEDGGHLLNLEPKKEGDSEPLVPVFNSMVAFEVPHMHAVSAVSADRYRYSIFGWWHQSGKRYDLPTEEEAGAANGGEMKTKRKAKRKAKARAKRKRPPAEE